MKTARHIGIGAIVFLLCCFRWAAASEWKEHASRHFIIYYKDTPVDFARTVADSAEEYYKQITQDLGFARYAGWDFENRARIYIFNDQQDYIESARQSGWSAGAAYYHNRMIKTYPSASGFFDSLLPHELGHIIFYEFIDNQFANLPRWFDEGVAMYQEKARRWGSHQTVKKALQEGTFIPLEDLSKTRLNHQSPRDLVELFYAESASVVYFLITEHGNFRFLNFCRQLKNGSTFERAFELAYPHIRNIQKLNDLWVVYLKKK